MKSGLIFQAFFRGDSFLTEEEWLINLAYLSLSFDWMTAFKENSACEIKLGKGPDQCEYFGYGQVI